MNDAELMIVDPTPAAVPAPITPPVGGGSLAAPPVEQILAMAVERGTDPANLERLVALMERVQDRRAEQAFNEALLAFRRQCPALVKNRTATDRNNKVLYRFIDLPELTAIVDPILFANGFSYSWDTDTSGEALVITCWLHHIAGHKRSAKFASKQSGTSIMSAAQIAASTMSFGQRRSLISVLGVCVDDDNDGRRAAPSPQPEADPDAPRVGTRVERQLAARDRAHQAAVEGRQPPSRPSDGSVEPAAPADPSAPPASGVTIDDLRQLATTWRVQTQNPKGRIADFNAWAARALGTDKNLENLSSWTPEMVATLQEALR